jgi:hypothetical protein
MDCEQITKGLVYFDLTPNKKIKNFIINLMGLE